MALYYLEIFFIKYTFQIICESNLFFFRNLENVTAIEHMNLVGLVNKGLLQSLLACVFFNNIKSFLSDI